MNTLTDIIRKVDNAMAKNFHVIKKTVDPKKGSGARRDIRELSNIAKDGWEKFSAPTVGINEKV